MAGFDYTSLLSGVGGSLLSGIFGGKKNKQSPAELAQQRLAEKQQQLAEMFGKYGNAEHNKYEMADADSQRQLGMYEDLLRQNPNTDQARAMDIGNATAGANRAFETGKSDLTAELARRGISDSSALSGGLSGLEGYRAGAISDATNDRYQREQADRYSRAAALTNVLSSNAANYNSNALGYYGQATGTNSSALGMFAPVAAGQDARTADYNNQRANSASIFGQIAGGLNPGPASSTGRTTSTPPIFGAPTPSGVTPGLNYKYSGYDPSTAKGLPLAPRQTRKVSSLGY